MYVADVAELTQQRRKADRAELMFELVVLLATVLFFYSFFGKSFNFYVWLTFWVMGTRFGLTAGRFIFFNIYLRQFLLELIWAGAIIWVFLGPVKMPLVLRASCLSVVSIVLYLLSRDSMMSYCQMVDQHLSVQQDPKYFRRMVRIRRRKISEFLRIPRTFAPLVFRASRSKFIFNFLPLAVTFVVYLVLERMGGLPGSSGYFTAFIAALFLLGSNISASPDWLQFSEAERLSIDLRKPILLMRGFADDDLSIDGGGTMINRFPRQLGYNSGRFQELVAKALDNIGPVITILDPKGEPRIGAAWKSLEIDSWKIEVSERIEKSALLVYLAGATEGLQWELDEGLLRRGEAAMLIVVPPLKDVKNIKGRWSEFRDAFEGRFTSSLPVDVEFAERKTIVLVFAAGETIMVQSDNRDGWSYISALRLAATLAEQNFDSQEQFNHFMQSNFGMISLRDDPSRF